MGDSRVVAARRTMRREGLRGRRLAPAGLSGATAHDRYDANPLKAFAVRTMH